MPRKNIDLRSLLDTPLPKLPYFEEFLLYLINNNYSENTIYNYYRDLTFFACFLQANNIDFSSVTKRDITYYKGWLKNREHIRYIRYLLEEHELKEQNKEAEESKSPEHEVLKHLQKIEYNHTKKSVSKSAEKEKAKKNKDPWASFKGGYAKNNNPSQLDASSINRILVALRHYLRFLVENDYPTPIFADHVKLVREGKKKPKVPSLEDVIRLVEAPSTLETDEFIAKRNRAILETLLATGMRISEVVKLDRHQLNPEGKLFITGKGRKQRLVYLTPRAIKHLVEYLKLRDDSYPALFIPKRGKGYARGDVRLSTNYIQMKIAEYRRRLGIVVPISAHSIRHAFATYMVERGANPAVLQILLGHESLQTTTKYVHASDLLAEKEHSKYHPVKE